MSWLFGILAVVAWVFFGVFFVRRVGCCGIWGRAWRRSGDFCWRIPHLFAEDGLSELVKKINRLADRCEEFKQEGADTRIR